MRLLPTCIMLLAVFAMAGCVTTPAIIGGPDLEVLAGDLLIYPTPLVVGQPLVAFLQARGQVLRPLGMSFGVLHVRGKGAEQRVYRSLDGLQLLLPSGRSASASKYQIDGVPLAALMTRIEAELRNQGIRRQAPHGQD